MNEFIRIALTFPPAIFSLMLLVVIVYWVFMIIGILDIDLFDVDVDLDLDLDLDIGGLAEGGAEGVIDGALEGAFDGVGDAEVPFGTKVLSAVFAGLSLGKVPVTISFSAFTLYAWILSFLGIYYLETFFGGSLNALTSAGLFGASTVLGLVGAGITVRPLRGIFKTHTRHGQETLIGRVCIVTTGRVDARFGQATLDDGGAGLILPIRCETPDNGIQRGDRVLIISYDPDTSHYFVDPYESMMRSENESNTMFDFDSALQATPLSDNATHNAHLISKTDHSGESQ